MRLRLLTLGGSILGEAFRACRSNPLRSGLSVLAVVAAVSTIVVVVTGLEGVKQFARRTSEKVFGSDTFVISQLVPGQLSRRELAEKLQRNPKIIRQDLSFLNRFTSRKVIYSGVLQKRVDIVFQGKRFEDANLSGVDSSMFEIRDLGIAEGRFLDQSETLRGSQVVVLGGEISDALFGTLDPLGRTVRIVGRGFRVVGLQAKQGTGGGVSLDRYAWIPRKAYERILSADSSLQIFARALAETSPDEAEGHAITSMRARRKLRPGAEDNFDLITPEAARSFVLSLSSRVGSAALPISLMALLAAVVVVANTVLVSVTQRVQEIGVRRAVGATRSQIMAEVLVESALIGLVGGALGFAIAWALLSVAGGLLNLRLILQPDTLAISLLAASFSGIIAGWYPARWAARIDVIHAIRLE